MAVMFIIDYIATGYVAAYEGLHQAVHVAGCVSEGLRVWQHNLRKLGSPHGKRPLPLPVGSTSKVPDIIMWLLQPLCKTWILVVSLTEGGKVHSVVPI